MDFVTRLPTMAEKKRTDPPLKLVNVKVKKRTFELLSEVAEATGQAIHDVVDRHCAGSLEQEHKAVQPKLRQVREGKTRIEKLQQEARKAAGA